MAADGLVHVGAWDGREYSRDDGRRLLLFEPQGEAFARLLENVKRPGAVFVNAACGAEAGEGEMHSAEPSHSSSLLEPDKALSIFPHISYEGSERVRITTVDATVEGYGLAGLWGEMVSDVQGYELEVLKGARRTLRGIQRLKVEVSTEALYRGQPLVESIHAALIQLGFSRSALDLYMGGVSGDAIYER